MSDNKLNFSIGEEYGLDFVEIEHSSKNSSDYDSTSMSGHTLTVKANRHGFGPVADDFKTYIGGEGHCTACMSHDEFPGDLNFAVNGTFTITTPEGKKYSNTVAVAQGHNAGSHNNWWIGSKQMYGKAVSTPVAIGIFHRCDAVDDAENEIEDAIANIADEVSKAVENIFKTIVSNLETDQFLNNVNAKIDEMAKTICDRIDKSTLFDANKAKDFVNELAVGIKKLMDEMVNNSNMLQDYITNIGKVVSDHINNLINDSSTNINKELHKIISDIIYAVNLLFVRFDGDRYSANHFSMSIIGYQIIDELNK